MDAADIDVAMLSAWCGPCGWLISNDEVAENLARFPARFTGLASVDLTDPMGGVREIRRCAANGFVGVRIVPWLWDLPPNDRRYYPVYAACVDLDLPFCTQIGHTGRGRCADPNLGGLFLILTTCCSTFLNFGSSADMSVRRGSRRCFRLRGSIPTSLSIRPLTRSTGCRSS
jgi:predicted TIM-barrel fold metal-dependent hydrolase